MIPTTSDDGPEDNSEDLFTRKSLAKMKAPAKTRETKKGGLGGKPPARHSTSEVPESSEDNTPDSSVRVMRTKRVVISEEDEEGQDEEEEGEVDGEEEDEVDELVEDEEDDELEYMDVDVDEDDAMVL